MTIIKKKLKAVSSISILFLYQKNCSCYQSFHQKWFSTKKTFLRKNLKQIGVIKKKVKKPFHPYPSYSFTKKVVQKIRIEGSRCGSESRNPCFHSSLFLFALGLKDGNRRILVCFPPYCNKPHFFPQSFSFFRSFQIVSSNL